MSHYCQFEPRILPLGDEALIVELGNKITPEVNERVIHFTRKVSEARLECIVELVPSYCAVAVYYKPDEMSGVVLIGKLRSILERDEPVLSETNSKLDKLVYSLPVLYGGRLGPDLQQVSEYTGISANDIISIHSNMLYRVYMLGFAPAFPYLGGMDERIACPRLKTPRILVHAGSVGIAESQTGVYPIDSPGGWQIIGRTPVPLFDPLADPPAIIQQGSYIRFIPVENDEYSRLEKMAQKGEIKPDPEVESF